MPPATTRSSARDLGIAILLVASLVTAVHWPVLSTQALGLDDNLFVTGNPLVTRPGVSSVSRFFGEVLTPSSVPGYYTPLTMTSLMADWALGGRPGNLGAFHRTHLALHVLSTVLLLLILYELFGSLVAAACAALIFGLHPLTVEPLAWISERKTMLAAPCALASIACYLRRARGGGPGWLAASLLAYFLGLLAKPTIVSLPAILLALDHWPLRRLGRSALIEKWPWLAITVASVVVTTISQARTAPFPPPEQSGVLRPVLQIAYVLAFYAGKIVWPVDLTTAYVPPRPYALTDPRIYGSVLVVLAIAAVLVLARRRLPGLFTGALVFVLALAPTFSVVTWSYFIVYDRYLYFPALGLAIMVAGALASWLTVRGGSLSAVAMAVAPVLLAAGLLACGTRVAYRHWRDSVALWTQTVRLAPGELDAHNGLAIAYEAQGDTTAAAAEYRAALALHPNYVFALINLGELLASTGESEEAAALLRRALALAPNDARPHVDLAAILLGRAGAGVEAADHLRAAVRLRPDWV
ncbi:MAG TPA: tetratricopeptide repeat protein, partial [Candidatus Eisenbacteria bacterium]|nr:tetratricopeptide repeat protein [Candidatus Eisenbacteria bacterium]